MTEERKADAPARSRHQRLESSVTGRVTLVTGGGEVVC